MNTLIRGQRRARLLVGCAVLVAGGAGAGLALASQDAPSEIPQASHAGAPAVSALVEAPRTSAAQDLSKLYDGNDFSVAVGLRSDEIRHVIDGTKADVFLAPTSGGWVCAIMVSSSMDGVPVSGCAPQSALADKPLVLRATGRTGATSVVGVVPDGYDSATLNGTRVGVMQNVFLAENVSSEEQTVRVEGGGLPPLAEVLK